MTSMMLNPNHDNLWLPYDEREGSQCGCCSWADAVDADSVWHCQNTPQQWQLYPSAACGWDTVRRFAHPISACQGNCEFHPLMRAEYRLSLGDLVDFYEAERVDAESDADRARRAAEIAADRAAAAVDVEAIKRECYARNVKERTMMGVRRGEAPKQLGQPCKWVIGEFKGDECWAWEYTDPKTKKRMCPHTCNRLHPGQADWHNEWFKNRNWKPAVAPPPPSAGAVRFAALGGGAPPVAVAPPKKRSSNRFALDEDEGQDAW